jgi:hypothetical protein
LEHQIRKAPRQDGFDEWCQVREQRLDHAFSAQYVSHNLVLVGGGDLDEYRAWRETLDYGSVRAPKTSPF